ncbi:MAG: matrixin family metalloprotease [Motiliproteus sp.]
MANSKSNTENLEDQLRSISKRLDAIENVVHTPTFNEEEDDSSSPEACGLPDVPLRELEAGIDPGRESLIRAIEKKWVNGSELKYFFFESGAWGGSNSQQKVVSDAFDEWKEVGLGLNFKEVDSPDDADIRIGFKRGDGSWSYVGRDIWTRPANERTMNFGWLLRGQNGRDTALHEIGHTLGFQHEQQNPFAGIEWDEDAVYRYFMGPPNNWSRQKTHHNVLRTLDPNSVEGSEWDPNSIMQYGIRPGLILSPAEFRSGLNPESGLSETDMARVRLFYPEMESRHKKLKRFVAERLNLAPAQQSNFVIKPTATKRYQIQTFGSSDTLMVLFEDNQGTLEHMAADDDSGWGHNARLEVRLVKDRQYVLRIRLYFSEESGEFAVMMW